LELKNFEQILLRWSN